MFLVIPLFNRKGRKELTQRAQRVDAKSAHFLTTECTEKGMEDAEFFQHSGVLRCLSW